MLFGKLLPREGKFFELFNQHADHIVEGARSFILLIQNYMATQKVEQVIPYSDFKESVKTGKVKDLVITDEYITGQKETDKGLQSSYSVF